MGSQDSVLNDEDWTIIAGYKKTASSGNSPYSGSASGVYTANSTGPFLTDVSTGDVVIRVSPKYTLTVDAQYFISPDTRLSSSRFPALA